LENTSSNTLKAIIENAIDGIITIDRRGIIESLNLSAAKIFGYSREELVGKNVNILMPEPFHSEHDGYIQKYHESRQPKIIGIGREVPGRKKDGTIFPFLLGVSEVNLGDRIIYTGFIHDITELKKAQNALKESEERYNAIINAAVHGIITINTRGVMEMINPSAARLFGYSAEEMMGKNVSMLMPEPDSSLHDSYIHNYLRTGVQKIIGIGREVTGMRKDGSLFPCYLSISEVTLADRTVFTGFVHDISGQKMAEENLRRYALELKRSNMELQDFAYVSSHDLQEPLRKIQAFGDRLKLKEGDKLSEEGKDYIERMLNAANRMQNLINDLLHFSRVTTKGEPFIRVDLNQILKEVISDLEISIEKNQAKVEYSELPELEADPTQMRQLFQNLISNAIKFRKKDEKPVIKIYARKLQRKAHLVSIPGDESYEIFFEDNGIGFDEKYLDKIFNIFQRLEVKKYEGSGVGLAICRKIASRHGGNITAKSAPGKGSVFIVTLSAKQTKE
jgi:two-component system sensor kinase FixL